MQYAEIPSHGWHGRQSVACNTLVDQTVPKQRTQNGYEIFSDFSALENF